MNILVTGANGLVGQSIVGEALKKDFRVLQLLNIKSECHANPKNGEFYKADITDFQSMSASIGAVKIDAIVHAAGLAHQFGGQKREKFWKVNVLGTENVAKLAVSLKAKHLVLISSVSVYGTQRGSESNFGKNPITEEAICRPQGFYAESKYESEKAAARVCEAGGVALTILRLATVIGEQDRGNVARLIETIDKGKFIWVGTGDNLKSLIYKEDVGKACLKVIGETNKTVVYNVTGAPVQMKEVVAEISLRLGRKIPKLRISPRLFQMLFSINASSLRIKKIENSSKTLEKWLSDDIFSGEKIKTACGFQPETSVREAIKRQVESYREKK